MNRSYLKTPRGYFSIYGWSFCLDMGKSCALPFPNSLHIPITAAKSFLKSKNVIFEVIKEE